MGLFDKLKSLVSDDKKDTGTIEIVAPLSGEIVNIEDVPDVVFAEKIVGDGIAIKPTGNKMVAPVDGTIGKIFETNHAFSIESDSGIELFVHFGIDTVELKGEGFKRIAEEGQPRHIPGLARKSGFQFRLGLHSACLPKIPILCSLPTPSVSAGRRPIHAPPSARHLARTRSVSSSKATNRTSGAPGSATHSRRVSTAITHARSSGKP